MATRTTPFPQQPAPLRFTVEQRAQLLRIDEAAAYLATGRRTIYRLIERGALPAVVQAGAKRIRLVDLVAYVESLTR